MKKIITILIVLGTINAFAQNNRPKLVVGIVVDQMRADYITKYWNKFGDDGFKKLVTLGFNCKNTHYNYVPTFTAPGHASIYTGSTPNIHGIIANTWYNKYGKITMYCTQDTSVITVGSATSAGIMSPKNLKASTITDELKLATNNNAKVIAVSLKDRGAILPGGHAADAAFWFDGETGAWITSSYYMDKLPGWVEGINKANPAMAFIQSGWKTLLPIDQYTESHADNNAFEGNFEGEDAPVFPHDLKKQFESSKYETIKSTPHGNTLTRMFAESAIENEKLGKDNITDFLAVSFSSSDYVGHQFGPQSVEVEDTYLRLDKDLESLLKTLDVQVGQGNYLLFLTSDHGAVEVPSYLLENKQAAGYVATKRLQVDVNTELAKKYGEGEWIEHFSNGQLFFSEKLKAEKNDIETFVLIESYLIAKPGIAGVYSKNQMITGTNENPMFKNLQRGYNQKLSGDVLLVYEPGWITEGMGLTGTTHGSPYNYDSHVPLIWYGKGINKGTSSQRVDITDIAITLSMLLDINIPNGSIGTPIKDLTKNAN